ncbi:hypothetical protein CAPTEDRAFT_227426 [Capitella teleta]|uniref:DUF4795 domain-containing protein n=2 Tax=Capitella teleta TaxID=283909 RepID=R7TYM9_CAPTE|nr:hypothetical protein CAPTEDRAFT_227426 [Capitella teleta]|eukprot:ELT99028.1 hypothetical protein CAPTEDRAFT_227426 [Capitella teleta]
MDLNGVIDFIESQDDDAFTLTSCETSFEDDLCLGRGRFREILETMKTQHSNISSPLDQDFAKCLEHLDHFENLIEELETISRASACPWAQVHCFLTSQKIQDMCRELNINSAAVLQVALQFWSSTRHLENKLWKLEKLVDNLTLGQLPSNEELFNRAKDEGKRPVTDMWQSMQLSSKVNANEEGVKKLMSLVEDLMKEMDLLKEINANLKKQIEESNNSDDILKRLKELGDSMSEMKSYIDMFPPLEAFNDYVTWATLEDSLKGLREKLAEDLAYSAPEPVERVVIEMSSQTEILSRPSTRPNSARPSTRPSSSRSRATTPGPSGDLLELLERLGKLTDQHDKLESRVGVIEEELKKKLDKTALEGFDLGISDAMSNQLDELRKMLDALKTGRDQDSEILNRLQNSMSKLISEVDRLSKTTGELQEDSKNKQKLIDELLKLCEKLDAMKADKDYVQTELEMKADKRLVDSKISRALFDTTCDELREMIKELIAKLGANEDELKRQLELMNEDIDGKLDRLEFEPFKNKLEQQLEAIMKRLNSMQHMEMDMDDDAAVIRKQLIQRFNCLSCDRPLEMAPNGPIPSAPSVNNSMPATRTSRPYTTFELDQIRQHSKSTPMPDIAMSTAARFHFTDSEHMVPEGQTEVVDLYATARACGGGHTLTHPHLRLTKTAQVNNLFREEEAPPPPPLLHREEADIQGVDGHIYRGRVDQRARFPDLQGSLAPKSARKPTPKPPPPSDKDRPVSARPARSAHKSSRPFSRQTEMVVPGMEGGVSTPLHVSAAFEPDLQAEAVN